MKHRNEAEKITDAFLFGDNPWKDVSSGYIGDYYRGVRLAARMVEVLKEGDEDTPLDEVIQRLDETYYHMVRAKDSTTYRKISLMELSDSVAEIVEPYDSLPDPSEYLKNNYLEYLRRTTSMRSSSDGNTTQRRETDSPRGCWIVKGVPEPTSDTPLSSPPHWRVMDLSKDVDLAFNAFHEHFGNSRGITINRISNETPDNHIGPLHVRFKYEYDKYGDYSDDKGFYYALPSDLEPVGNPVGFGQTKPEAICNLIVNAELRKTELAGVQ